MYTSVPLEKGFKERYCATYSSDNASVLRRESDAEFMRCMLRDARDGNLRGVITTRIRMPFYRRDLHVLAVDCDNPVAMSVAREHFFRKGHDVRVVESSPDHFWLISSYAGRWGDVIGRMQEVPGADPKHVEVSKEFRCITFRAFPKHAEYPRFAQDARWRGEVPDEVSGWMYSFQKYFDPLDSLCWHSLVEQLVLDKRIAPRPKGKCPRCGCTKTDRFCARCGLDLSEDNFGSAVQHAGWCKCGTQQFWRIAQDSYTLEPDIYCIKCKQWHPTMPGSGTRDWPKWAKALPRWTREEAQDHEPTRTS